MSAPFHVGWPGSTSSGSLSNHHPMLAISSRAAPPAASGWRSGPRMEHRPSPAGGTCSATDRLEGQRILGAFLFTDEAHRRQIEHRIELGDAVLRRGVIALDREGAQDQWIVLTFTLL